MTITVSITRSPSPQDTSRLILQSLCEGIIKTRHSCQSYLDIDGVAAYLTKFNHGTVARKFTVDTVSIVIYQL